MPRGCLVWGRGPASGGGGQRWGRRGGGAEGLSVAGLVGPGNGRWLDPPEQGVFLKVGVVYFRVVEGTMSAAAFVARLGAVDDEGGHLDEVAQFQDFGGDAIAPVEFLNFFLQGAQSGGGALETFARADDGDVIPHQAADFIPVVVDDDQFIDVLGIAADPWIEGEFAGVACGQRFFLQHVVDGAVPHDGSFQQAVAGEAVCSVEASASDLTDGPQSAQRGGSIEVGLDATALVMSRWYDRNRFFRHVDAEIHQGLKDVRESVFQPSAGFRCDVEEDAFGAGFFDFPVDGSGHDIARGEVFAPVIFVHERLAVGADEHAAFTAEGFADEEAAFLRMEEAGGVELDEFHVGDGYAGTPSHGHAVAGGDFRVGGVLVDAAAASGGEDDAIGAESFDVSGVLIERVESEAPVFLGVAEFAGGDEVDGVIAFEENNVFFGAGGGEQVSGNFQTGLVALVQDASAGVAALDA